MSANMLLPLLTTALSAVFALLLARHFFQRRTPYYGVWALGLLWYALSAAAEFVGAVSHWTPTLFRVWYVSGAIGVAAYLGAGTLYLHRDRAFGAAAVVMILLAGLPAAAAGAATVAAGVAVAAVCGALTVWRRPRAFPHVALAMLVLATAFAAVVVWTSPVDPTRLPASADEVVTGQAASSDVRILTPAFNIVGAAVLILGAAVSAYSFARSRNNQRRLASNGLIAVGAFVPSLTSGLTRFGLTSGFFVGQLIGVSCLLIGFLLVGSSGRATAHGAPATQHVRRA